MKARKWSVSTQWFLMLLTLKKFNSSPPQLSHAPDSISRHSQQNTGAAQVPKHGNTSGLSWRHFCYFSWNISLWTLNNSCERHLPKHRTSRETIKDRWNVLMRESTTKHKVHFHPWKSEQRTRVWRGSKAEGTNCGTLLARPWGDKAMANVIPVCSNPILGRCQPRLLLTSYLSGACSSTGKGLCTHIVILCI